MEVIYYQPGGYGPTPHLHSPLKTVFKTPQYSTTQTRRNLLQMAHIAFLNYLTPVSCTYVRYLPVAANVLAAINSLCCGGTGKSLLGMVSLAMEEKYILRK